MDKLTPAKRSWNMSRIRSKDTKPEKIIRSMLHRKGYRFRLHQKNLPGKPDIVLQKYKTVIFVHGCFWHRHKGCKYAYNPKSRVEFWQNKFRENVNRFKTVENELKKVKWRVIVIWECEVKESNDNLESMLTNILYDISSPDMPVAAEERTKYTT